MPTATSILQAFSENYPGMIQFLTVLAYVLGMWAGGSAFLKLWRRQRYEPDASIGSVISRFVVCAMFLFLPTSIESGQETLFNSPEILGYAYGSTLSAAGKIIVDTVLGFVQIVGLWAFLYGWWLLMRANERAYDSGVGAKATTHIVGGVFGINIVATLHMAAETFGLEALLQYIIVPS